MSNFKFLTLSTDDGTWDAFQKDWDSQCDELGECFEDYAPDSLGVLAKLADGSLLHADGPGSKTVAGALRDDENGRYYLGCMLNLARLPRSDGMTLRVRHLTVSPLLDYGMAEPKLYAQVLVHTLTGVVGVSESPLSANNIRFHLRSPTDAAFFSAFGEALDGEEIFASVQTRGSWLYITKV